MSELTLEEMLGSVTQKKAEVQKEEPKTDETPKVEDAPKVEEVAVPEEKKEEPTEKMVSLSALQEERMKRRQLKKENDDLKAELQKAKSDSPYNSTYNEVEKPSSGVVTRAEYLDRELFKSVSAVRRSAKDATEMLEIFDKAVEENPSLYNQMLDASDPGTFAYEYGKSVKNQDVYGTTPEEAFKRGVAAGEKASKEKVFKDLKQKKAIGDALPKNISEGGTSGSGSEMAEWTQPSEKEYWG